MSETTIKVVNAADCACGDRSTYSGDPSLDFPDGSTCSLPVEWRLRVLKTMLEREFGDGFTVESVDLYGLSPLEQSNVLDAIVATQSSFPVVLISGIVACVGDIDLDAIAAEVARVRRA